MTCSWTLQSQRVCFAFVFPCFRCWLTNTRHMNGTKSHHLPMWCHCSRGGWQLQQHREHGELQGSPQGPVQGVPCYGEITVLAGAPGHALRWAPSISLTRARRAQELRVLLTRQPQVSILHLSTFCSAEELVFVSPRLGGMRSSRCTRTPRKGKSVPSTLWLTFILRQGLWGSPGAFAADAE